MVQSTGQTRAEGKGFAAGTMLQLRWGWTLESLGTSADDPFDFLILGHQLGQALPVSKPFMFMKYMTTCSDIWRHDSVLY